MAPRGSSFDYTSNMHEITVYYKPSFENSVDPDRLASIRPHTFFFRIINPC